MTAHPGASTPAFQIIAPSVRRAPVVAHIPHASTSIPASIRAELLLDDQELHDELLRLTDWYTDDLFAWLTDYGATLFVDRLSRLVFDPERFLDDANEPTSRIGQGVVYTRGTQGQRIRVDDQELKARRVETLYRPYHAAVDDLVAGMLEDFGSCTLLDCHSFSSSPLPSELDQQPDRPDICIGTDIEHTPPRLADALEAAFAAAGFRVARDRPFSGTFVPSGFYRREPRVHSVMIEVRRGLYMDESTARRLPGYTTVRSAIERAITSSGFV